MAKGDTTATADERATAAKMSTESVPTLEDRKREAGLPVHIDRERLAGLGTVTFVKIEASQATNPSTQKVEPGLLATIRTDDDRDYTVFIANMVLAKDLAAVKLPFRAKIVKHGRTWVFA
jgi:hypothetical protein